MLESVLTLVIVHAHCTWRFIRNMCTIVATLGHSCLLLGRKSVQQFCHNYKNKYVPYMQLYWLSWLCMHIAPDVSYACIKLSPLLAIHAYCWGASVRPAKILPQSLIKIYELHATVLTLIIGHAHWTWRFKNCKIVATLGNSCLLLGRNIPLCKCATNQDSLLLATLR